MERIKALYKIISIASIIIRQFYLPNPFEPLGITVVTPYFVLTPVMLNLLAGVILVPVTYGIVGLYYHGGFPTGGSLLFLFFYCIHTGLIYLTVRLFLLTGVLWLSVIVILVFYVVAHVLIKRFVFWAEEVW